MNALRYVQNALSLIYGAYGGPATEGQSRTAVTDKKWTHMKITQPPWGNAPGAASMYANACVSECAQAFTLRMQHHVKLVSGNLVRTSLRLNKTVWNSIS